MAIVNEDGRKYAKLVCVEKNNRNKIYLMQENANGTFTATWGRVEGSMASKDYPISQWDKILKEKTGRSKEPYTDVTDLHAVAVATNDSGSQFHASRAAAVKTFVEKLMGYQKDSVKRNYTVSVAQVTQAQVDTAQEKLDAIISSVKVGADVDALNDMLVHYYRIIPRKMKKVQDHLIVSLKNKKEVDATFADLLTPEQDALDSMAGQVLQTATTSAADKKDEKNKEAIAQDLLDALGLDFLETTAAEVAMIKKMLGGESKRFSAAYRVSNKHTEGKYNGLMKTVSNKKADLLWHGSRNENWWSIIQKGLLIRPAGAILTGSMFGNGIYLASKALKSIGYTSSRGSRWANGSADRAYLALYDAHLGSQYVIERWKNEHTYLDESKMKTVGHDSVWAKGGYDLVNDEFIVYNIAQCTVRYIVEIS